MIFTYLNNATVWSKFCDTYEAIYILMDQFDVWYLVSRLSPFLLALFFQQSALVGSAKCRLGRQADQSMLRSEPTWSPHGHHPGG